jgi:hypothetical protein
MQDQRILRTVRTNAVVILLVFLGTLLAHTQGKVYIVLGSDTAIWDGMDVGQYKCTYSLGLFTDPARNAARVMDPSFRSSMIDSYGTPLKLTWWMMAGNIFRYATNTDVPHANTMTLHLMKEYYGSPIRTWGDELTLHYHTFVWSDYNGDGAWYWNQAKSFQESGDDFNATLAEMLLEESTLPVSFRSGWHYMDNGWQARLDNILPYSFHNDWPAVRTSTTEPIDNVYDWSRAPGTFIPFHPSPADYQLPGSGRGWNVRSRYMSAADSSFVDKIFAAATSGTDQVVCLWAHLPEVDFPENVQKVNASLHMVAPRYPAVTFRYCTAVEAMQRWRKTQDTTRPALTLEETGSGDMVQWIVSSSEPIFQPEPIVALKTRYEQYRLLSTTKLSANSWVTATAVPRGDIAKIAAAVTDTAGNSSIAILRFLPDDIYVDNADAGYGELAGTWTTSASASWGVTSRVSTLGPTDSSAARWTVTIPSTGMYSVMVQFPAITNLASRVRFTILQGSQAIDSVLFNTGLPSKAWVYLTTRLMTQGGTYSIEMSGSGALQAGKVMAADVVKITALVRQKWIIPPAAVDAGDVIVQEPTPRSVSVGNQGIQSLTLTGASLVNRTGIIQTTFPLLVPAMGNVTLPLLFTVTRAGSVSDTLLIASDDPVLPEVRIPVTAFAREYFAILDDRDSLSYREAGSWFFSNAQAYGTSSRYSTPAAGVSATYTVRLRKGGEFEIAEIVPKTLNASARARYALFVGGGAVDSVFIDQNPGSGSWVPLMTRMLPADSEVVVQISDAMSPVIAGRVLRADALRFQWLRSGPTAVSEPIPPTPGKFEMAQNYPNPFNPSTRLTFLIPVRGRVRLQISDVLGRTVSTLVDEDRPAGRYEAAFDGTGLPSGVYFGRLTFNGSTLVRRMLLVR